jgi:hypothetical protein
MGATQPVQDEPRKRSQSVREIPDKDFFDVAAFFRFPCQVQRGDVDEQLQ